MTNILRKTRKLGKTGSIALCLLALLAAYPPAAQACEDPPVQVILTVIKPPTGYMRINGQLYLSCSLTFDINTDLNIEAIKSFPDPPTPDYTFLNWAPNFVFGEPNFLGCGNPLYHTLTTNATVQPYFDDDPRFVDANLEAMIRFLVGSTSGNLTTAQLATLTSLTLVNNDITDLTGLELCTALTTLFIAENPITNFDALASLVNLTDLRIISCGMVDMSPIEELVGLNTLVLTDNDIEDLSLLLDNMGLGAGDFINIEENPLSLEALYLQAYELEKRGATVIATGGENLDGDDFSNAEELRYVQYYFNDPEFVNDLYHYYLTSDTLPGIGRTCFENLDTVAVTVEVEGEGSVYVGDGYATEGNPKTWDFARYAAGCPTLCTAPTGCAPNTITLTAAPEADWYFQRWWGMVQSDRNEETPFVCQDPQTILVDFVYRPGLDGLDIISDLALFLTAIGESATVEEFDRNKIVYNENLERVYAGNGIPDAAELWLIEYVLKHASISLSHRSGVVSEALWATWTANLARAQTDLPSEEDYVINVVAAYMTLGDFGSEQSVIDLVETHFQATLNPENYDNSQSRYLAADEDADNDGVTNLAEWETASPEGALEALPLFGLSAVNAADTPDATNNSPEGCDNQMCLDTGSMTVSAVCVRVPQSSPAPDDHASADPMGSDIALGTPIHVAAQPDTADGSGFKAWSAPGTLIDGSRKRNEDFLLPGNTSAVAGCERRRTHIAPDTDFYGITASGANGAVATTEEIDGIVCRVVAGPPGSYVTLSAQPKISGQKIIKWTVKVSPSGGDPRESFGPRVTARVGLYAIPTASSQPFEDLKGISVRSSEGGTALGSVGYAAGTFKGFFVARETSYLAFSADADPDYEFDHWEGYPNAGVTVTGLNAQDVSFMRAHFRKKVEHVLKIGSAGNMPCSGYVTVSPAKKYYTQDEEVTVSAHPAPGYVFAFWLGLYDSDNQTETDDVIAITMTRNRSLTPVFMDKPFKLVQRLSTHDREVIDMGKAFITEAPAMPTLYASVPNGKPSFDVQWQLSVTFDPDQQPEQTFWFPGGEEQPDSPADVPGNQQWLVPFGAILMGGQATLTYQYCGMEQPESFTFQIEGANPNRAAILAELGTLLFQAISWQESTHRQFLGSRNINGITTLYDLQYVGLPLPNGGNDGGYGLMQITNSPAPTMRDIWHWRQNCQSGVSKFGGNVSQSHNHVAWWNNGGKLPDPDPDIALTDEQHMNNALALYNSGNYYYGARLNPGSESEYETYTLGGDGCTYADSVRALMAQNPPPWFAE